MNKRKIILDCDPGHDDAFAIMLAGAFDCIDLLGITVVAGNQTIEKTAKNAFNVARYLNITCPIAIGSDRPIKKEPVNCEQIHGQSGLDGFDFPKYNYKFHCKNGIDFMIDTILENEHVTVVTTGPMTNLGHAINKNKDILKHIDEVVLMGGSIANGNVTPAAEFNINCDPEAANIVFTSGVKIKMIGLDVTRKVLVLPSVIERMEKLHTKASDLFVKLMKFFNKTQQEVFALPAGPLHDPVTIASLIEPELITYKYCNTTIDTTDGPSNGRTNCDIFDYLHQEKNSYVAIDINVEEFWNIIEKGLLNSK